MLDKKLLEILACPHCKGDLYYEKINKELVCLVDSLAFPIKEGVPVMLVDSARKISTSEREKYQ
jgi:uncharacterized protein YbaR (Trm112 family)